MLLCYGDALRKLMLIIYDLGLLNGEYVFFTMEILLASCEAQDGRDVEACKAFEGILDVGQYIPDSQDYEDFKTAVYNRMPEMNYTMSFPNQVSTLNLQEMKKYKTTIMAFYEAFNYFVSASIIS